MPGKQRAVRSDERKGVLGGERRLLGGDDIRKHLQFILVQKEAAEDCKKGKETALVSSIELSGSGVRDE